MGLQTDTHAVKSAAIESPKQNDENSVMTKDQKRLFLVFTKVLLKYLETKDPVMFLLAKQTIREAIDHESCSAAGETCSISRMKKRLETLVPKEHWKKSEEFLLQKLQDKSATEDSSDSKDFFDSLFSTPCAVNNICS